MQLLLLSIFLCCGIQEMPNAYEDINEAIYKAALAARNKYENKEEAIGLIYEQGGKFYFTDPYSTNPDSRHTKGAFKIPKGSLRYIVHNHPIGESGVFSTDDIQIADSLGVPSAVIFGDKPIIRIYTPGKSTKRSRRRGSIIEHTSHGDEFTFVPPTKEQFKVALDDAETKRDLTRAFNEFSK